MININIHGNDNSELLLDVQNNEVGIIVVTKDKKQFDFIIERNEWEIIKQFIESQFKSE
jgi:hypothetical protein